MRKFLMIAVSGVLFASACGYADPVRQSRHGGLLVLNGDEELAMQDAERLMAAHCGPDNFEVVRVEEIVVAVEDHIETDLATGREEIYTEEITELQLRYRCFVPSPPPL